MWYHDRLDRINEDHKLQIKIDDGDNKLQIQIDELKNMVLELSK
jgi:hypothetical protein